MDWRVFLSAFGLIFLAELGDKTQLAAIAMTARSQSPVAVFLGAMAGLGLVTLIGVGVGGTIIRLIPEGYLRIGSGALFVFLGISILLGWGLLVIFCGRGRDDSGRKTSGRSDRDPPKIQELGALVDTGGWILGLMRSNF